VRPSATLVLAVSLALLPTVSAAQRPQQAKTPAKVQRVGLLMQTSPAAAAHIAAAFIEGLRDAGHVEGKGVVFEYRWAEGKLDRLPELAVELVRAKVDLIIASSIDAAEAARRATTTLPIVMVNAAEPVESGLARSLARPGGNVTGLSAQLTPEIRAKQIQLIKEAVPGLVRVVILRRTAVADAAVWKEYEEGGRTLEVKVQFANVESIEDLPRALGAIPRERTALLVPGDPVFFTQRQRIVALTLEHRLPTMFYAREFTLAGGLMSYSARLTDQFRRAAEYADKILRGANPATLPIEQPTQFELVINLKTAKALKLTMPQGLLVRADEVIQ
jgi:putative ABC transport system substrate-binding protein